MQEIWVQSLGQKNPLEMEMATHPSILIWDLNCPPRRGKGRWKKASKQNLSGRDSSLLFILFPGIQTQEYSFYLSLQRRGSLGSDNNGGSHKRESSF